MPFRNILSRSAKEKEAEAAQDKDDGSNNRETSSPPPGYAPAPPPDYDAENVLTPPDITAGFANLNLGRQNKDAFPTADEATAHLVLLECFYRLRQRIGSSDGLFGIDGNVVTGVGLSDKKVTDELLTKLAEKRWAIYVARAVDRFDKWINAIIPSAKTATTKDLEQQGMSGILCYPSAAVAPLQFTTSTLPPVDMLMIWHAYMLNPRAYLEDCLRNGRMKLWHTPMPWTAVAQAINPGTFAYQDNKDADGYFQQLTGLPWDNLTGLDKKSVACPSCRKEMLLPWTTCAEYASGSSTKSADSLRTFVDAMLSSGNGYCDKDLHWTCASCGNGITHELLKVGKFCGDLRLLLQKDTPMGGTILGPAGIPWRFAEQVDVMTREITKIPNRILSCGLGVKLLDKSSISSMDAIKAYIEVAMQDKKYMPIVRETASARLLRNERIGIRRMMSRYWDNSSPFALDLVGAVVRQGSFIEKMHNIDWLHSPALPSTMARLLLKYERFVLLMANRQEMAVPTLDVDLAWHTHQLSPYGYMSHVVKVTKQFIDHDDKVAETKLNDGFAWTSKTYQKLFGEPYSECTCWYCEAVRESHTSTTSRLFKGSAKRVEEQLHTTDTDPKKNVHISAHNAVRPTDDTQKYQKTAAAKAAELDKAYTKACERARKKGKPEPRRDDYYYSDAWGYPIWIPAYSPYMGYVGYCPAYYSLNPGCMAVGAGMAGNCASGTCGGGVAAGSCGGGGCSAAGKEARVDSS